MKAFSILIIVLVLFGCNSNESNSLIEEKLEKYYDNGSNISLDRETRLKYIDSAKGLAKISIKNDSILIKNYFKVANRYFGICVVIL